MDVQKARQTETHIFVHAPQHKSYHREPSMTPPLFCLACSLSWKSTAVTCNLSGGKAFLFLQIFTSLLVCACMCYLQQLKGSQQLPSCAVPSVNLVVLQLWWEPRRAVVLVTHLDDGLCERPTYELRLTLNTAL